MSAASNGQYQTNPLKEDAELKALLKDLESSVKSEQEFELWRNSFLTRFIEFLDANGTEKAEQSYWKFSDTMSSFVRVINKLNAYIGDGSLSEDKCSVKALQCLQELSRTITQVVEEVDQLIPGTIAMEKRTGFTKFHIGAVLVRDGFREYGRMSMCADALEQMEKTLRNVADKLVLLNMNSYLWKLNVFCDVMADLGLFNAMLKCREYVSADDDEEAILLTSNLYPSFDPNSSVTVFERSIPALSCDDVSAEPHESKLELSLTVFNQSETSLHKIPTDDVSEAQENLQPLLDQESSVSVLNQSDRSICIVPPSPSHEMVLYGAGKQYNSDLPYPKLHTESSITVLDRSITLIDNSASDTAHSRQKGFLEREPAPYGSSSVDRKGFLEREPAPYGSSSVDRQRSSNVADSCESLNNHAMKEREAAPYCQVSGQKASRPTNVVSGETLPAVKDPSKLPHQPSVDGKKPLQRVRWNPRDYYRNKAQSSKPDNKEKEKASSKNSVPSDKKSVNEIQTQSSEADYQEKKNILSFLQRKPKDDTARAGDSNDAGSKASSDASSRKTPPKIISVAEVPKDTKEKSINSQTNESDEQDSDKPPRRQRKWSLKDFYAGAKERISNNLPKKKERKAKTLRQNRDSTNENQANGANPTRRNETTTATREDVNFNSEQDYDEVSESSTMVSDADDVAIKESPDLTNNGSEVLVEEASESSTMVSDTEEIMSTPARSKAHEASKQLKQKPPISSKPDAVPQKVEPKHIRPKENEPLTIRPAKKEEPASIQISKKAKSAPNDDKKPENEVLSKKPDQRDESAPVQVPKKTKSSTRTDKKSAPEHKSASNEKNVTRSKSDSVLPPSDQKQRRLKKNDPSSKASSVPKSEKQTTSPVDNEAREQPVARSVSDSGLPSSDYRKPRAKKSDPVSKKSEKAKDAAVAKNIGVKDESASSEQPVAIAKSDSGLPSSDRKQRRPKTQDSVPEPCSSILTTENAAAGTAEKPVGKNKAASRKQGKGNHQPAEPNAEGAASSGDSAVSICAVQPALRPSSESPMESFLRVQRQMELISKTNSVDMYVLPELAPYGYSEDTFANYLPVNTKNQAIFEELDRIIQATARKLNSYICYGTIGWSYGSEDKLEDFEPPRLFIRQLVVDRLGNQIACYDKTQICDYGASSESRFFVQGPSSVPTSFEVCSRDETSAFRFGLLIGADIRYPNLSRFLTADIDHRVDCIVQPTACFRDCAFRTWSSFQETRAVENSIYWIGANYSGDEYGGTSIVQPFVDDDHEPVTLDCEDGYAIIQISRETLDEVRATFPFYARLLAEESSKVDNESTGKVDAMADASELETAGSKTDSIQDVASNVVEDASESETVVSDLDGDESECLKSQDVFPEPEKSNLSIASNQDNYQAEKIKVESITDPLPHGRKDEIDSNDSLADVTVKVKNTKSEKKVLTEEVRRKCYMWYTRLGQPTRDQMKRRVVKMEKSCDITIEDVDALPWIAGGTMISATELNKLMLSSD